MLHKIAIIIALAAMFQAGGSSAADQSGIEGEQTVEVQSVGDGIWRLRFGVPEKITPVSLRDSSVKSDALTRLPKCETMPFSPADVKFRAMDRGCVIELPMFAGEQVYGFGLNLKVMNPTGTRKTVRVSDNQDGDLGDSHAPVPFYLSNLGYGVFIDSARYVSFYSGNLAEKPSSPPKHTKADGKVATAITELYSKLERGTGKMEIEVPTAAGVDVYVFAGPTMREAAQRFNLFSGGGYLPPLWGLGMLYRGYGRYNAEQVLKLAEDFRENHIPCDVFGLEPGWQTQTYSCSYVWSGERWPDPAGFLARMKEMGYELNLWEHAFVHPTSPIYEAMMPHAGSHIVWKGLVPDFSTAEAKRIFADYHEENFVKKGVTGFKLDECDHQPLSSKPWSFPELASFPSGADGEQMHCLIGVLYQRVLADIFRRNGLRTFGQVRASHALAAPLPFVLYSDHYDHRDYVRGLTTCGFGGVLWQPEVRSCDSIEELYRRIQTCVFSPQAVVNAWFLALPPWRQINTEKNCRGELLPNHEEVQNACRELFRLRMSLVPYLYSAYARYCYEGVPPVRAIVMDYPGDTGTFYLDNEYMLGDSLLVAPLFAGQKKREVYLPEGDWHCFLSGKRFPGKQKRAIEAPPEQIPVFVKSGSLIPLAKPVEHIKLDTCFEITVKAFGDDCADFVLYEDDGVTTEFEKGKQNRVTLSWNPAGGGNVRREGGYDGVRYKVVAWEKTGE
ncbi:MAG TPA: glycoside hydrolase family 31 protein [Candidatus Brocadiia bacterium]|nr:glycoside hydrolase family 31 protein [Candidatus Brocadiia bacterium]